MMKFTNSKYNWKNSN